MLDNIKKFISTHKFKLLLGIVVLTYFKTCGVGDRVKDEHRELEAKITDLQNKVDSLVDVTPTKEEIDKSAHNSVWGKETSRELNHLLVNYTVSKLFVT